MNSNGLVSDNITGIRFVLRALRFRNYRLFFAGQSISLIGTWMQLIAVSWLTYRLTNSAFLLGLIAFTSQFPVFLLSPFAGVLADRWNRKNILVITQALAMVQAFILALLAFTNAIAVWHIAVLSTFVGVVNAFDAPVRQSFVVDMVEDRKDLANAIALNSFIFNSARIIGSSVAGVLISAAGEGVCFLLNGISFLAVIIALVSMRIRPRAVHDKDSHVITALKEGVAYAFGNTPIRYILLFVTLMSVTGMSFLVIMPVVAKDILRGGASTLGFLMGATGLGALGGAGYLASKKNIHGLERVISIAAAIFGAGLVLFSFSRFLWLSLALMLCIGFGMMVHMISSNTLLQHFTEDDKRGRVMSLYTIAFMGMVPLGNLLAGGLAGKIGAPYTLLISGCACIFGSLIFMSKIPLVKERAGSHS